MDPVMLVTLFSAVVAAVWTAWTWREEHQEVRELQRDQAAALYVNPLLFNTVALQRRLHGILEGRDLAMFREERAARDAAPSYPAIETLYMLSSFFAWSFVNVRYGPYTRDPKVIELMVRISRTLDTRTRFPGDAFRFTVAQQQSLGHAVLRRLGDSTTGRVGDAGSSLAEFGITTAYEFEQDVRDPKSPLAALYQSRAVRRALESIDRATRPEQLEGRERLTAVFELIAPLIDHLERLEGFDVTFHEDVTTLPESDASPRAPAGAAAPRILHRMKGRIRLGIPRLRTDTDYARRLVAFIRSRDDVEDVSVNPLAGSIAIRYATAVPDEDFQARLVSSIARVFRRDAAEVAAADDGRPAPAAAAEPGPPARRPRPARRRPARLRETAIGS
jgi:hypothetical protein